MADGTTRPIESIHAGDQVLGYDEISAALRPARVGGVHDPRIVDRYYIINGTISVTGTQPVLKNGGWVSVGSLKIGDRLTGADGSAVPIFSIKRIDERVTVYNLQIDGLQTCVAHGVVVHNKPPDATIPVYPCHSNCY